VFKQDRMGECRPERDKLCALSVRECLLECVREIERERERERKREREREQMRKGAKNHKLFPHKFDV